MSVKTKEDVKLESFFNAFTVRTKYGTMAAATATPIIILASIYVGWGYIRRAWKGANKPESYSRSISLGALHGGKFALERLIAYHIARANKEALDEAEKEFKDEFSEQHPDFNRLQHIATVLETHGREAVAAEILENKLQEVRNDKKPHEAYEIEMMLAEMYIYKGDFKKVLEFECLKHEEISDARRPLYKAIIYQLKKNTVDARRCWKEFKSIRSLFLSPEESLENDNIAEIQKVVQHFDEFEKVVASLKQDIPPT